MNEDFELKEYCEARYQCPHCKAKRAVVYVDKGSAFYCLAEGKRIELSECELSDEQVVEWTDKDTDVADYYTDETGKEKIYVDRSKHPYELPPWFGGTIIRVCKRVTPQQAIESLEQAHPYVDTVECLTDGKRAVMTNLDDVHPESVEWLWEGRLPCGKLVMLDGDPGLGKSTLLLHIAAVLSIGGSFPDGAPIDSAVRSILISGEDGVSDTIVPRLMAAGADLKMIKLLESVQEEGENRPFSLARDINVLRTEIIDIGARFVVIDPVMAFVGGRIDVNRDDSIRQLLQPLAQVASETRATIIFCRHLNKSGGSKAIYRGGASIGFTAAARVVMLVAEEPGEETQRRILAVGKSNMAQKPRSLAFHIEEDPENKVGRIVWDGPCDYSADDLVSPVTPRKGKADNSAEATELLSECLADGPIKSAELEALMTAHNISSRQMKAAKKNLETIPLKETLPDRQVRWWTALPGQEIPCERSTADPEEVHSQERTSSEKPELLRNSHRELILFEGTPRTRSKTRVVSET